MGNKIFQFILNRFKTGAVLIVLCISLFPAIALAQVSHITSVTASPANPVPGGTVAVTVIYCGQNYYNSDHFDVMLEPSSAMTMLDCPVPGQIFLVDGNNPAGPASPLVSTRDDSTDGSSGGWNSGDSQTTIPAGSCPATQVFDVTMPTTMAIGCYNIVAAVNASYIGCTNSYPASQQGSAAVCVNYSSASPSLNIQKSSIGDSAQSGDLILWQINYQALNTTPVTITDTVPAGTSMAGPSPFTGSISPGGTVTGSGAAGSPITWILNNTASSPINYVWFLTTVGASPPAEITNTASAGSAATGMTS